jgi:LuxR family transcriptional regulator
VFLDVEIAMYAYATNADFPKVVTLSSRECEVLRWAAEGKTAYESGVILGLTERTVNFHISRSIEKLNASNKTNAVAKAILMGLIAFE